MLDSVFDLFVQSRRTLDRAAGGLGVGLTLVRSLVSMHGGTVTAHSEGEGKGSEFVVRLPLVRSQRVQGTHEASSTLRPAVEAPARRLPERANIVVVEDNADSREMLCELLQLSGFRCRTADSGKAALALVEEVLPDVAILDVGLPEIDGYEVARRIRRSPNPAMADICLIALTGYGQPSDRAISKDAGFDYHLVKPVQADYLLDLLTKLRSGPSGQPTEGADALPEDQPAQTEAAQ
jgi:two-component system CheB/CheR fusion protein